MLDRDGKTEHSGPDLRGKCQSFLLLSVVLPVGFHRCSLPG